MTTTTTTTTRQAYKDLANAALEVGATLRLHNVEVYWCHGSERWVVFDTRSSDQVDKATRLTTHQSASQAVGHAANLLYGSDPRLRTLRGARRGDLVIDTKAGPNEARVGRVLDVAVDGLRIDWEAHPCDCPDPGWWPFSSRYRLAFPFYEDLEAGKRCWAAAAPGCSNGRHHVSK